MPASFLHFPRLNLRIFPLQSLDLPILSTGDRTWPTYLTVYQSQSDKRKVDYYCTGLLADDEGNIFESVNIRKLAQKK